MSAVTAARFGIKKSDQLNNARQERDRARKEMDDARVAVKFVAENLAFIRGTRKLRANQSELAASTMFVAKQPREATKIIEGEIRQLINDLTKAREEQDRVWIAKRILGFTSWRGWGVLDDVHTAFKDAFPKELPEEFAVKLVDIYTRRADFLKNLAKKEGVMRPGKTQRKKDCVRARHGQSDGIAAIERQERVEQKK